MTILSDLKKDKLAELQQIYSGNILKRKEFKVTKTVPRMKMNAHQQMDAVSSHLNKIRNQKIIIGSLIRTVSSGDFKKKNSASIKDIMELDLGGIQEGILIDFFQGKLPLSRRGTLNISKE